MSASYFFGVVVPYTAFVIFVIGIIYRIVRWANSAVPFKIPTPCGQEKSLPWIKSSRLESPFSNLGVVGRMAADILLFRSLFRDSKYNYAVDKAVDTKWLWIFAIIFHWSMLMVLIIWHLRLLIEPIPAWILALQAADGVFEVHLPLHVINISISGVAMLTALICLLGRRIIFAKERAISLPSDYFALLLLISIAATGLIMKYFIGVDVEKVKELALGLVTLNPVAPELHWLFYLHLVLVSILIAYFPFSKLMHAGGIFFSPTRNQPNDNRVRRHVNPWDYPVEIQTWDEYAERFEKELKLVEEG
jgi:nitrate reductase gamma subunit